MQIVRKIVKNWLTISLFLIFLTGLSFAEVLDSMDSSTNWSVQTDNGASLSTSTVTGLTGNAIQLDYDINSGEWVAIKREDFANVDISSGDAVSFHYKGTGDSNHIKFQIADADGDVFERKLANLSNISTWTQAILTFESLSHWEGTGDGTLDRGNISKIGFAVNVSEGGSGKVAIDGLESYQLNTPSVGLLFDNFNCGSPPNDLGGNGGAMSPSGNYDPSITYDSGNAKEGVYALSITYDFPSGQWSGYWSFMRSDESGYDLSGYQNLKFWVKGATGGEKFKVEIADTGDTPGSEPWVQVGSVTTAYQQVTIPLADFTGLDTSAVRQVNIVFDQTPRSGKVYIDNIRFIGAGSSSEGPISVLDKMDEPAPISGWQNYGCDEDKGVTTTSLDSISGQDGRALELTYKFNRGDIDDWVVIERDWGRNIAGSDSFRFKYKGTGSVNNLELRVADKNGTIFSKKIYNVTNTEGEWKTATIPYEELFLLTSGTYSNGDIADELDLTKIEAIFFVVSKGDGGSGTLTIDELEVLEVDDFRKGRGDALIRSIVVPDNPISPNNDGIKDRASFKFTLARYANITLKIYR
ncbi:MAG: hypothetical protein GH154_03920, partial [Firmicutes bacterium]|nr:hypothetical protein [Bacillota bacterium]